MVGLANPAAPKGGFNKLFVMVPVMLAARKLDAEDPTTVQYLRIAYGAMQSICVLIVLYTYFKAQSLTGKDSSKVVFVPSAPTPFADPDAKKKYTRVEYGAHILSTARSLLGSTLFGVCMTVGLHVYKGMAMGLAIQTIMGPFNLIENPLVKALFMGSGFNPQDKIFEEKALEELAGEDEVVDEAGAEIPRGRLLALNGAANKSAESPTYTFEELMLDTWDEGNKADLNSFVKAVTNKNCNHRSKENGWTPLMILSGLASSERTASAIQAVIALGGNPGVTDGEGWNALHWSAFHGSVQAAQKLYEYDATLADLKDKEGKLPLEMAQQEGNKDVAKYLEEAIASNAAASEADDNDGIRKRK